MTPCNQIFTKGEKKNQNLDSVSQGNGLFEQNENNFLRDDDLLEDNHLNE